MKFVTLFPQTRNVHLLKDIGMIPYQLYKQYGWDAQIACYEDAQGYEYVENEVKGLKLEFIKRTHWGKLKDGICFLYRRSREIDILNLYHLNLASFLWAIFYHVFGGRGIIYLKLDMSYKGYHDCLANNPVGFIKRCTIRIADVVSVEATVFQEGLRKVFGEKIIHIPNGYYLPEQDGENRKPKQKVILTVGDIGTPAKATDILMEAFAKTCGQHDWVLRIVGPIDSSFQEYSTTFFETHPALRDRIMMIGPIYEKQQLLAEYESASVFALPSRWEAFPLVLLEAVSQGCYLVTSDMIPSAFDVNGQGKYGCIVPAGDVDSLSEVFLHLCTGREDYQRLRYDIENFAREEFLWEKIVAKLEEELVSKQGSY